MPSSVFALLPTHQLEQTTVWHSFDLQNGVNMQKHSPEAEHDVDDDEKRLSVLQVYFCDAFSEVLCGREFQCMQIRMTRQ